MPSQKHNGGRPEHEDFNKDEIEKLRTLLGALAKPSGTCSLAHSGEFQFSLGLNVSDGTFKNSWVIDSGATDHMTHSSQNFSTYTPCPNSRKIATADGSLITVAGFGDIKINSSFVLKNVLHVPRLSTNLVSIQKLTQDLCCNVIFHSTYYIF